MTAMDGGERPDGGRSAFTSLIDRPPAGHDLERARLMDEAWRAFGGEMGGAVQAALAAGKSPPQVAYAIGETVHNFFRTRGLTLTSFELRQRVAELLAAAPRVPPTQPAADTRPEPPAAPAEPLPLVAFAEDPATRPSRWTGGETAPERPPVAEAALAPPASPLVTMLPREPEDARVARIGREVRRRLGRDPFGAPRAAVRQAIAAAIDRLEPAAGRNGDLGQRVLSDLCGLGPLDALWADQSVRAVLVNGVESLQVERDDGMVAVVGGFRDRAHLEEIAARLAGPSGAPALTLDLRDGGEAVVLRPPVAPEGPVLVLRRGEPGEATLERLVAAGRLARPMAELLRLAVRSHLTVAVAGPGGSGKTCW